METSTILPEWGLFGGFAARFLTDLLTLGLLTWLGYRPRLGRSEAAFTFGMFNLLIFLMCSLMFNCKVGLEFAFGLFAIFSMLRYRADVLSMRDMAYLFAAIGIGLMNALDIGQRPFIWLADGAIIAAAVLLERLFLSEKIGSMKVAFEQVGPLMGADQEAIRQVLSEKTGFEVVGFRIESISFPDDVAKVLVFFRQGKGGF